MNFRRKQQQLKSVCGLLCFVRICLRCLEWVLDVDTHSRYCREWMCIVVCSILVWHVSPIETFCLACCVWLGFSDESLWCPLGKQRWQAMSKYERWVNGDMDGSFSQPLAEKTVSVNVNECHHWKPLAVFFGVARGPLWRRAF